MRLASGLGMLRRDVQRTALAVLSISNVQVRSVQALRIAETDAVGIAAAAGSFRETALDHNFSGLEESPHELLLLTHSLILSYTCPFLLSREK